MKSQVIEWAPFRLKSGKSEAELAAASDELQRDFLASQSGYLRRDVVRKDDGSFADIILWSSRHEAEAAMAKVANSTSCARYFALMQEGDGDPGAGVAHFTVLKSY